MNRRGVLAGAMAMSVAGLSKGRTPTGLSWFCWSAEVWLSEPRELIASLPPGTTRLLLGLNAHELAGASFGRDARLGRLLAAAHDKGVFVDLLLGDPHWVLPQGRPYLAGLLERADHLAFDGLNLDIERSQLPHLHRTVWQEGAIAMMRGVRAVTAKPVAFTTHFADATQPAFLQALADAGASELMPMIYVSFAHLVRERAMRVLEASPVRVTVAQSFERSLARGESWRHLGASRAMREWSSLAGQLAEHPRFSGLAVQSIEEFRQAS